MGWDGKKTDLNPMSWIDLPVKSSNVSLSPDEPGWLERVMEWGSTRSGRVLII